MRACINAYTQADTHIHTMRTCSILLLASCKQLEELKEPFSDSYIMEEEKFCFSVQEQQQPWFRPPSKKEIYSQVNVQHIHHEVLHILNKSSLMPVQNSSLDACCLTDKDWCPV